MLPRPTRRPRIPSQTIAILGAIIAATLLLAATSQFGDPRLAARAQAARSARASGELVRLSWESMMRSELTPAPPRGSVLRIRAVDASTPPIILHTAGHGLAPESSTDSGALFTVLLESAYGAAARGDLAAAISTARDALAVDPENARLAEGRLALARWWSVLEEPMEVKAQRGAITQIEAPSFVDGTSIELLACLIPPIDRRRAFELLTDEAPDLPPPNDRWTARAGPFLFEPDPWWSALRQQLETRPAGSNASDDLDWDVAFQTQARIDAAGRAWLDGEQLPEPGLGWQLTSSPKGGRSLIAMRRDASGLTIAALHEPDLEAALQAATAEELRPPLVLSFGAEAPSNGTPEEEVLYGPVRLPKLLRPYSIHHLDPEATARVELRRLALLRGALVVLALAVLGVSLIGARSLGRSRHLASLRSTFVASVSHDLRTPTQAILLMAETLEQGRVGQGSAATRDRYYSRIRREAQRLRRLVEDLLDGARIDRGEGARIQRKDVAMGAFFEELEGAMNERAGSTGAELAIRRDALPESMNVDPDGVYRAVWNVFENALRYGKSAGAGAHIDVEFRHHLGALEVTVSDRGKGIDPTDYEAVFAPFERLDGRKTRLRPDPAGQHTKSNDSGTGLGLAIVRAIARAHGGDATVGAAAVGAQFKLTFPEKDQQEDEAA